MGRSLFILWVLFGALAPLRASAAWVEERQVGPYLIRSEFPLRNLQGLVDDLVDLQADIERQLKLKCEPQEIQIHLFRSRGSYVDYLNKRGIPEGASRKALFVQGSDAGRVYAYQSREMETDVRHETTHALLHSALPYVPMWLDEGLAEYFEVSPGLREKRNPHHSELKWVLPFGWRPGLERLEAKHDLQEMEKKDYRDSWAIVHYILHSPPAAREAMAKYFEEVQSGKQPAPLSQHLRRRISNLDQQIADHFK